MTQPTPSETPVPRSGVSLRLAGMSDVGITRDHNEDSFAFLDLSSGQTHADVSDGTIDVGLRGVVLVVADGMGGAAAGEIASEMAVEAVLDTFRAQWMQGVGRDTDTFVETIRDAADTANHRIFAYAGAHPEHAGMGTTATIAGLLGNSLYLAQVGDSRAYIVRDGTAQQITKDQSLMQQLIEAGEMTPDQAEVSERRNIILQALGPDSTVRPDFTQQPLARGDTLVLCSDGLSGLVRAPEIARTATEEQDVRSICKRLIDRANQLGGPDNITVIAARFDGDALRDSGNGDSFGYNSFPLAGTLNDDARKPLPPAREARATLRSDPTPKRGTPMPSRAILDESAGTREDHALLGAPEPVVEERRRAVQPVFLVLGVIAFLPISWFLFALFG